MGDVVGLHAQWGTVQPERLLDLLQGTGAGGEVGGAFELVLFEHLLGVAGDGVHEGAFVATHRHAQVHPGAAQVREQFAQALQGARFDRDEDLLGDRRAQPVVADLTGGAVGVQSVELQQELLHELGGFGVVGTVGHPAAFATDSPVAHVEDLHPHLQGVHRQGDDVGVGAVGEHDGVALHGLGERVQRVAQHGGPLELKVLGGLVHLGTDASQDRRGAPGHEGAEVRDDGAMLVGANPVHTGSRALADVAQQAGASLGAGPVEHAGGARAHREDAQQGLHGVADGPRLAERAEVAPPLAAFAAADEHAWELIAPRDAQPRVRLVVAIHDVEPRVELLDPRVLELQGLQLVLHDGPLHVGSGGDHPLGARVQGRDVLEVRVETVAQVLRLADVDDLTVLVAESVDAGLGGNGSGGGPVGGRVSHGSALPRR